MSTLMKARIEMMRVVALVSLGKQRGSVLPDEIKKDHQKWVSDEGGRNPKV